MFVINLVKRSTKSAMGNGLPDFITRDRHLQKRSELKEGTNRMPEWTTWVNHAQWPQWTSQTLITEVKQTTERQLVKVEQLYIIITKIQPEEMCIFAISMAHLLANLSFWRCLHIFKHANDTTTDVSMPINATTLTVTVNGENPTTYTSIKNLELYVKMFKVPAPRIRVDLERIAPYMSANDTTNLRHYKDQKQRPKPHQLTMKWLLFVSQLLKQRSPPACHLIKQNSKKALTVMYILTMTFPQTRNTIITRTCTTNAKGNLSAYYM